MIIKKYLNNASKEIIGQVEKVHFPELKSNNLHARIDTGAKTSSIHASKANVKNDILKVVFFSEGNRHYSGEEQLFTNFSTTVVASSNGMVQNRYKIKLKVIINHRIINASFTLADRSTQVYPVLVGRNILRGKFIVDINLGTPLIAKEVMRTKQIRKQQNQGVII